jgi:putative endonuclease
LLHSVVWPSFPSVVWPSFPRKRESSIDGGMDKQFCVYILASRRNGTLYIGVTSQLATRVWQHKSKVVEGFTAKYGVDKLVYYEAHGCAESAIVREKQLKKWRRAWKIELIKGQNPESRDLYEEIM